MTELDSYVAEDLKKYSGRYFPLKAGMLTRLLVKKADCTKLHPNPNDEFTFPDIGPSYRIIGEYEQKYRDAMRHGQTHVEEPLIVEKMYPDGYMIMNGHHRWAAAMRMGVKQIPIRIVNFAHEADIDEVMKNSNNYKRVTFDLDEVIFTKDDSSSEKELIFPFNRIYKERLKIGVPALFDYLKNNGYDIWVYSEKFYSIDYIRTLFKKYHVNVNGIVTGTAKKGIMGSDAKKRISDQISKRYKYTIHIDNDTVLKSTTESKDFVEFEIGKENTNWSSEIMRIIGDIN